MQKQFGKLSVMFFSKLKDFLKKDIYVATLTAILFVAFFANYRFGTTLIGWDSLQTELNISSNIARNFASVWQEYQGLGSVVGNAHAVEFFRNLILYPFSLILPQSVIRYLYTFSMIYIGVISTYFLLKKFLSKETSFEFIAFIGALFYFLNLGTVQNFFVPFEPFSAFYAFLPLSILFLYKYIKGESGWVQLLLVLLLTTFSFEVPTIFIVYSIIIFPALGMAIVIGLFAKQKALVKKSVFASLLLLVANTFWILPFIYYFTSNLQVRFSSISNRLSSDNATLLNTGYSNLTDVSILRGFWFSNIDYIDKAGKYGYMLSDWIDWIGVKNMSSLGYVFGIVIILGFISLFFLKIPKCVKFFISYLFLITLFFFFGSNGISSDLYGFIIISKPLFKEIFRFSFTKWIVPASLSFAFLFSFGTLFISKLFSNLAFSPKVFFVSRFIIPTLLLVYMAPVFFGHLIYPSVRQDIPGDYINLQKYLENEPKSSRIAILPASTFWGWTFTDWGYRGSGFLWYGINQSVLSRTFDVWNTKNEQFYNEFQYAIYSSDAVLLNYVLEKYQVNYLVFDESIISPESEKALFGDETKQLLSKMSGISKTFESGKLIVYKYKLQNLVDDYIYTPLDYSKNSNSYEFSNIDPSFISEDLNYITFNSQNNVQFAFPDDRKLAGLLSSPDSTNNLLPIDFIPIGIGSNIYEIAFPQFFVNQPIPAIVTFNSDNIGVDYLYPKVVDKDGNIILSKSNKDIFDVNLDPTKKILFNNTPIDSVGFGGYFLVKPESTIVSYDEDPVEIYDFSDEIYSVEASGCSDEFSEYAKLYDKYPESVTVTTSKGAACLNFEKDIDSGFVSVYKIEYLYKKSDVAKQIYCLYSKIFDKCINEKYQGSLVQGDVFDRYTDYVVFEGNDELSLQLILEAADYTKPQNITYKDIKVSRYKVWNVNVFSPRASAYFSESKVSVSKDSLPVRVVLPNYGDLNKKYLPGSTKYNPISKNCDNFNEKVYDRQILSNIKGLPLYKYTATDAISCDTVDTQFINPYADYLITFDSKKITGKGLDICLAGINLDKCLIQDRLSGTGRESFILPSYKLAKSIRINLGNQSIGDVPTENELYSVNVQYFPYKWLKGIYVKPADAAISSQNGVVVSVVSKKAIYKYEVDVKKSDDVSSTDELSGLIILNQSFEKGWGLYEKDSCVFGFTTPFTCKKSNSEHVLAKNWANAWVVPAVSASYVIIFWPQYLQFFGYLVLIIYIVWIIRKIGR